MAARQSSTLKIIVSPPASADVGPFTLNVGNQQCGAAIVREFDLKMSHIDISEDLVAGSDEEYSYSFTFSNHGPR